MIRYIQFTFLVIIAATVVMAVSAFATPNLDDPKGCPLPENSYRITSKVGYRIDPFDGQKRYHAGVDMAAEEGTEVSSTMAGTVIIAGNQGKAGNTVVIQNASGYETWFCQLEEIKVQEGDEIIAGLVIGTVGQSGRATGPHLHYEIRKDGEVVDPTSTF